MKCIMITGDNPLTAVHVAKDVEIVDRDVLILDIRENPKSDAGSWSSRPSCFVSSSKKYRFGMEDSRRIEDYSRQPRRASGSIPPRQVRHLYDGSCPEAVRKSSVLGGPGTTYMGIRACITLAKGVHPHVAQIARLHDTHGGRRYE